MYKRIATASTVVVLAASLAACTSGQVGQIPPSQQADLNANTLQFAAGTANIGTGTVDGTGAGATALSLGTNFVATYRQPNGLTGTLVNSPTLTGPAGWTVPAGDNGVTDASGANAPFGSGTDAGTNSLTSYPQGKPFTTQPSPGNTFGLTGGVFEYGFGPNNSSNNFLGGVPFGTYALPFFLSHKSTDANVYLGGPPGYMPASHPNIHDGTYPVGFNGFTQGFTDMLVTPVTGTYSLVLVVPSSPTSNLTLNKSATLATAVPLGPTTLSLFTSNADGGASVTTTVPAGATEAVVDFIDRGPMLDANGNPPPGYVNCHPGTGGTLYYSTVVRGVGARVATIPGSAGPIAGNGTQQKAFCTLDQVRVLAVSANYPLYESGPPQSFNPAPTITGPNGQADISTAPRMETLF